jgi:hypothetical protein
MMQRTLRGGFVMNELIVTTGASRSLVRRERGATLFTSPDYGIDPPLRDGEERMHACWANESTSSAMTWAAVAAAVIQMLDTARVALGRRDEQEAARCSQVLAHC